MYKLKLFSVAAALLLATSMTTNSASAWGDSYKGWGGGGSGWGDINYGGGNDAYGYGGKSFAGGETTVDTWGGFNVDTCGGTSCNSKKAYMGLRFQQKATGGGFTSGHGLSKAGSGVVGGFTFDGNVGFHRD